MDPNRIRSIPVECLLNNVIDEDFQAVLRPLGLFQTIFMIARFTIISNFITPNNKTYYIKSAIAATTLIAIICYRFTVYTTVLDVHSSETLMILLWFDCVYYSITAVIIYITSALQSSNTVLLIIKLQQALRTISLNTKMLYNMKIWNWIHILSIFGLYVVYSFITDGILYEFNVSQLILLLPGLIIDLNVIYAARTVTFTGNVLALWNRKMMNYEKMHCGDTEENQLTGQAMLTAYIDIIKSFRLTEKIYRFAITYHTIEIFVHVLYTVQAYLEYSKLDAKVSESLTNTLTKILTVTWSIKNILLLISLSFACDKFYRNVDNAEAFCTKMLQLEKSDLRKTCKNVLRFNRAAFRKMSACGVLTVDAALPLRLLAAVLTYTVVLLQFAFL